MQTSITKKDRLYKRRKTACWFLVLLFGVIGLVCLLLLIFRLVTESDPLLAASLTASLMFVSVFCFAVAMPYLGNLSRLDECYIHSQSYEVFRDCIGPFPTVLWLESLVFRLAPKSPPKNPDRDAGRTSGAKK
jgi:hypothetical protein